MTRTIQVSSIAFASTWFAFACSEMPEDCTATGVCSDAGTPLVDGGADAGIDSGAEIDAGMDAGETDAGVDAGTPDAGPTSCPGGDGFDGMRIDWALPRPADAPARVVTDLTWSTFDIDADDLPDLVFLDLPLSGVGDTRWLVFRSTGSGFGPSTDWTLPRPAPTLTADSAALAYATIDLTGDGIVDLVVTDDAPADVGTTRWIVYPGNASGFGAGMDWVLPRPVADVSGSTSSVNWEAFDLTGDSIPDLVFTEDDVMSGVGTTRWLVYPGGASGFGAATDWSLPRAVDRRGLIDLGVEYNTVDYTNDGLPDLVFANDAFTTVGVGTTRWLVYPNTGSGFGAAMDWSLPAPVARFRLESPDTNFGVMDMNADGFPDLVYTKDPRMNVGLTRWLVYFGSEAGFASTVVDWFLPRPAEDFVTYMVDNTTFTMDMTGDGRPDFVVSNDTTPGTGTSTWLVYPQCSGL